MDPEAVDGWRLKLKVRYNADIRIVAVERDASFSKLVSRIVDDFGFVLDPVLKYQDADGDMILLTCQNDLNELVAFAKESARSAVVVHVVPDGSSDRVSEVLDTPTPATPALHLAPLVAGASAPPPSRSPLPDELAPPPPAILRQAAAGTSLLRQTLDSPLDAVASALPSAAAPQRRISHAAHSRSHSEPTGIAFRWKRGDQILGQGAFGTVFLGLNVDTGEMLAVKQLDTSDVSAKEMASLEHEISMLRGLHHHNIVRYYGTERTPDTLSILLEYVPGGSIRTMLDRFGPLGEPVVRAYSRQLLLGLEYLHRAGIAHRDVKGGNVLINTDGRVKLADFGASKRLTANSNLVTATGTGMEGLKGTPLWMAPEVIREQHVHKGWKKADIWSVGCTVVEMATGKPPWSNFDNPVTAMYHIACTDEIPPMPPTLSSTAHDFLRLCFRRDPALRPDVTKLLLHPFVASAATPLLHAQQGGGASGIGRQAAFGGTMSGGSLGASGGSGSAYLPPRPSTGAGVGRERSSSHHRLLAVPEHPTYFPTMMNAVEEEEGRQAGTGAARGRATRKRSQHAARQPDDIAAAAAPVVSARGAAATTDDVHASPPRSQAVLVRQSSMPDPATARMLAAAAPAFAGDAWHAGLNVLDTLQASPRTVTADSAGGGGARPSTSGSAFVKVRGSGTGGDAAAGGAAVSGRLPSGTRAVSSSGGGPSPGRSSLSSSSPRSPPGSRGDGHGSQLLPASIPPPPQMQLQLQAVTTGLYQSPASGGGGGAVAVHDWTAEGESDGSGVDDVDSAAAALRLASVTGAAPGFRLPTPRFEGVLPPPLQIPPQMMAEACAGDASAAVSSVVEADQEQLVVSTNVAVDAALPSPALSSVASQAGTPSPLPAHPSADGEHSNLHVSKCGAPDALFGGFDTTAYDGDFFEESHDETNSASAHAPSGEVASVEGPIIQKLAVVAVADQHQVRLAGEADVANLIDVSAVPGARSDAHLDVPLTLLAPASHQGESVADTVVTAVPAPTLSSAGQSPVLGALRVPSRRTPMARCGSTTDVPVPLTVVRRDIDASAAAAADQSSLRSSPSSAQTPRLLPGIPKAPSGLDVQRNPLGSARQFSVSSLLHSTAPAHQVTVSAAPQRLEVLSPQQQEWPMPVAWDEGRESDRSLVQPQRESSGSNTVSIHQPSVEGASANSKLMGSRTQLARYCDVLPAAPGDSAAGSGPLHSTPLLCPPHAGVILSARADSCDAPPISSRLTRATVKEGTGNSASAASKGPASSGRTPRESLPSQPTSPTQKKPASATVAPSRTARLSYVRGVANATSPPPGNVSPTQGSTVLPVARPRVTDVSSSEPADEGDPVASPVRRPTQAVTSSSGAASIDTRYASKIPRPSQTRARSKTSTTATSAAPTFGSSDASASLDPPLGMHKTSMSSHVEPAQRSGVITMSHSRGQYARPVHTAVTSVASAAAAASGSAARPSSRGMHPPTPPVAATTVQQRLMTHVFDDATVPFEDGYTAQRPPYFSYASEGLPQPATLHASVSVSEVPEVSDQHALPAAAASSLTLLRARSGGYRRPIKKAAAPSNSSGGVLHPPRSAAPRRTAGSGGHFGTDNESTASLHDDSPALSVAWHSQSSQVPVEPSQADLQAAMDAHVLHALSQRLMQAEVSVQQQQLRQRSQAHQPPPAERWDADRAHAGEGSEMWQVPSDAQESNSARASVAMHSSVRTEPSARPGLGSWGPSPLMWTPTAGTGFNSNIEQAVPVGALAGLAVPHGGSTDQIPQTHKHAPATSLQSSRRGGALIASAAASGASAPRGGAQAAGSTGGLSGTRAAATRNLAASESLAPAINPTLVAVGQSSQQHSRPQAAPGGSNFSAQALIGNGGGGGPLVLSQHAVERDFFRTGGGEITEGYFNLRASPVRLPGDPSGSSTTQRPQPAVGASKQSQQQLQQQSLVIAGGGLLSSGPSGAAAHRLPPTLDQPQARSRVNTSAAPETDALAAAGWRGSGMAAAASGGHLVRPDRAGSDPDLDPCGSSIDADVDAVCGGGAEGESSLGADSVSAAAPITSNVFLPALVAVGRAIGGLSGGGGAEHVAAPNAGPLLPASASMLWMDSSAQSEVGGRRDGELQAIQQQQLPGGRGAATAATGIVMVSPRTLVSYPAAGPRQQIVQAQPQTAAAPPNSSTIPSVRTRGWEASTSTSSSLVAAAASTSLGGSRRTLSTAAVLASAAQSPFLSYSAAAEHEQ